VGERQRVCCSRSRTAIGLIDFLMPKKTHASVRLDFAGASCVTQLAQTLKAACVWLRSEHFS